MNMKENTEKLTEKAFLRLIITSIVGIILCMTFLCSTTWAWFAESIDENKNTIVSAQGNVEIVSISGPDSSLDATKLEALLSDAGTDLASGKYTVTLRKPAGSSSGYFVLKWNNETYYAEGIRRNSENDVEVVASYQFVVPDGATLNGACIEIRWGIYSGEAVIKKIIEDNSIEQLVFVVPAPVTDPNTGGENGSTSIDGGTGESGSSTDDPITGGENGSTSIDGGAGESGGSTDDPITGGENGSTSIDGGAGESGSSTDDPITGDQSGDSQDPAQVNSTEGAPVDDQNSNNDVQQ